jgi:hypothetical protein
MIIKPVDDANDLFEVQNFYPEELLSRFLSTDHLTQPYTKEAWQADWPRRRLVHDLDPIYNELGDYVTSQLTEISKTVNTELARCDTGFWLDDAGFRMSPHVDNAMVRIAMQVYLNENDITLGTVFYDNTLSVRYRPLYKINQGYLMINNPKQLHGMMDKVPADSYRISSYTWFYPKT